MKQKNVLKSAIMFALAAAFVIYSGCGDDNTTNNNNGGGSGGGYHPTLNFSVGQSFTYTWDTLYPNNTVIRKRWSSVDVVQAQTTIGGQQGYPFAGALYDSTVMPIIPKPELYYVRYDQSAGKYYQYGLQALINSGSPLTWDLVADFDAARGSTYTIASVNYSIPVPTIGTINFTGPLTGKVDSTSIQSTNNPPATVQCYHVEMLADLSGPAGNLTASAKIYVDYFIGCINPIGMVEFKTRPFDFKLNGSTVNSQGGYDRKLKSHANP
jgi:hypothetical protein